MSPVSGDSGELLQDSCDLPEEVSIQLMSPVSGDFNVDPAETWVHEGNGFHSINVPSEWGLTWRAELCLLT
jgi:hypothetical protein